jgi:hypothetical protein
VIPQRYCNSTPLFATQGVLIQDPPVANFDVVSACLRDTVLFNNSTTSGCDSMSVNQNDSILYFHWDLAIAQIL